MGSKTTIVLRGKQLSAVGKKRAVLFNTSSTLLLSFRDLGWGARIWSSLSGPSVFGGGHDGPRVPGVWTGLG